LIYFPVRFLIAAGFISGILLHLNFLEGFEEVILYDLFQFFKIPSTYVGGDLFIGSSFNPIPFIPPAHIHILFLVFFLSVAIVTRANFRIRLKFLYFGLLCFVSFLVVQFLMVVLLLSLGIPSEDGFFQSSIISSGIIAGLVIEASLLFTITLPKPSIVKSLVKRSYVDEYIYLALLLFVSGLLLYALFTVFDIKDDPITATYIAINISTILTFKYYLSYFIWEVKHPSWEKYRDNHSKTLKQKPPVSFLLPAFNEEKRIGGLIESIDVAASNYDGKTEIILVNDGSTDKTEEICKEKIFNLKYSSGKLFTIPNSGKGFALHYGLERLSGEVIFRIDSDSVVDKNVIDPIMKHYEDPAIGSVSGMIFPIEEKSFWQKAMVYLGCLFVFYRRGQELIDSILVQPGAFSTFRKDALVKAGGWTADQFGEDGEVTIRLGRCGYKNSFEQHSVIYSEAPKDIPELREQRIRWGIAYYHSRGRNIRILKEKNGPRPIMIMFNLLSHGGGFAQALFWPFLIAAIFVDERFSLYNFIVISGVPIKLFFIDLIMFSLQYIVYVYFLFRFKKAYLIKYLPFMRIYMLMLSLFFKPEAMEILLRWSSKWQQHTAESNKALRKLIKKPS